MSVHLDHVVADWLLLELGRRGAVPPGAAGPPNDGTAAVSDSSYEPADAQRRLAELEQYERVLAETPQGLP